MFCIEGKEKIYLINSDSLPCREILVSDAYVITYGFSQKATLSVSSFEDQRMVMCLQRSITTLNGKITEPQEFAIMLSDNSDASTVMLAVAVAVVCGATAEELSKLVF